MRKVADYAAILTPEERERFKDIIDECLNREMQINAHANDAGNALDNLKIESARMKEAMDGLLSDVQKLAHDTGTTLLRIMPSKGRVN